MADCNHDCSSCKSKCSNPIPRYKTHEGTNIRHVIGVVSGKGGVGKSLVTSLLASKMAKMGYRVGIMDADLTGPSIPKAFEVIDMIGSDGDGMYPQVSKDGIKIMSVNLLLDNPEMPVVMRGPVLSGIIKQFYSDTLWGDLDYLFIDMPPGTGDVNLTIYQSVPVEGVIIVSTPQDLVKLIVKKSINMANMMNIKVFGLIENMSYVKCPCCGEAIELFGKSKVLDVCKEFDIPLLASLPIDPKITELVDNGDIYKYNCPIDFIDNNPTFFEE